MLRLTGLLFLAVMLLVPAGPAAAVSPTGQQYINKIVGGGPAALRQVSQQICRRGLAERAVLDVLAEKLLQSYNDTSHLGVDAASWACKALGQSGDLRYRNVLVKVSGTAPSDKTRKYAQQSLGQLPGGDTKAPYQKGSVDLAAMRQKLLNGQSPVPDTQPRKAVRQGRQHRGGKNKLGQVKDGMALPDVTALVGQPTTTASHLTGKTFNPFYHGGDTARLIHFYKGQGRVIYTRRSAYSDTWRVLEVQLDPNEKGYR